MRILIQRVSKASVSIEGKTESKIGKGLLIFVGIEEVDDIEDINWLSHKIVNLRIFDDAAGIMNLSVTDIGAEILAVSQFTLHASTKKGNRPSYIKAAKPDIAVPLYEKFCSTLNNLLSTPLKTGRFGTDMQVELVNDGPVTIWIDSKSRE